VNDNPTVELVLSVQTVAEPDVEPDILGKKLVRIESDFAESG
jgi:hypothetical protein